MSSANGSAPSGLKARLCGMMFLEIFIWGAWYPLFFSYVPKLGFEGWQQQLILNAFHISALLAIFFGNQFADRNFAAEKFLAFSQFVGGAAMIGLSLIKKPDVGPPSFWLFFGLIMLHTLLYVPTVSITNAIAFANLKDPAKEFGVVRMWGTIGWIAAAWPFVFIMVDWNRVPAMGNMGFTAWLGDALGTSRTGADLLSATRYTFMAAGIVSLVLAVFSFSLPHTPPKRSGESLAWLEAMSYLRRPFILVLFIVTFIDAAVHQSYFYWTANFLEHGVKIPGNWIQPVMSVGQVAEILTMAVLGYVLKTLGWRLTMTIGVLGHAARFAVFSFFPEQTPTILVILLHGICYAFFFATVYIFIDHFFPKDARASAQGLFNMLILGVGPFVSNLASGWLGKLYALDLGPTGEPTSVDFHELFKVPTLVALVAASLLLVAFHPPKEKTSDVPE
jgi:MFS family permease